MRRPRAIARLLALSVGGWLMSGTAMVHAQVLVGDPFISSYNNWIDTFSGPPAVGQPPDWRLHLLNGTLMETSDGRGADGGTNTGTYTPFVLIQDAFTTPASYDFNTRLYTSDDDLFGVVFGWQDINNYFRVSLRQQANGNLGGTTGVAVQKVVNGVITQISPAGTGPGNTAAPTLDMINSRAPIDLTVAVDGSSYAVSIAGVNGGAPLQTGSDADLAAGKVGILSWAQRNVGANPAWGVELDSLAVTSPAGGATLFNDPIADYSPIAWRRLTMVNAMGTPLAGTGEDAGNFGLDFRRRTILDTSNGFDFATTAAPNVDFLGPAVVVDEPGSAGMSDYEMRVRMLNGDNDGIGVLVRVQDDDTFYRVNFSQESIGTTEARAPRGLSVQKVSDGVWSELFRDDQDNPLFLYTPGTPFDVSVKAIGDQLMVQVIQDPAGAAMVIDYPVIIDANDPLLTGTVGLANWGSATTAGNGATWSSYGGVPGPLVVVIPEPAAGAVAMLAAVGLLRRMRRSASK